MVRSVSYNQLLSDLPRLGAVNLTASLTRTDNGFPTDLRTPLYNGMDRQGLISFLEGVIGSTGIPEIDSLDESERSKVGPLSIQLPWKERADTLSSYFSQFGEVDLAFAESIAIRFLPETLQPDELRDAFEAMPKGTSLGLPYMTRNRSYVGSYLRRAMEAQSSDDIYPAVIGWRGQASGLHSTPKQRVVWMFDHAETILGLSILKPVLRHLAGSKGFAAWSNLDDVDVAMTRILNRARGRNIYSIDFSGFDASVNSTLISAIFSAFGTVFTSGHERIDLLRDVFLTVPIVTPFQVHHGRNGGVPSGSALTNLVDSFVNIVAMHIIAQSLGVQVEDFECLGDDAVILFSEDPGSQAIERAYHKLGLEVSASKQFVSPTAVHYLQRVHTLDYLRDGVCVGVRSPYRALTGMSGYERFRRDWNAYLDTMRWIMQTENLKNDPRFVRFVLDFLTPGDKILSAHTPIGSIVRKAGGVSHARVTLGVESFPYTERDPDKIASFETVRVLNSV